MMSLLVTEMININFILKTSDFSISVIVKWILPVCSNIHTLRLSGISIGCHDEIARLEKLKKLEVWAKKANDLNKVTLITSRIMTTLLTSSQIFRSCHQVEILWMDVTRLPLSDWAELEPAENMTDVTLRWRNGPSIEEVLPIVKRWRHLKRLTFTDLVKTKISLTPSEVLRDFIVQMKHLSHFHIVPHQNYDDDYDDDVELKILRDKVNELILPRRPKFKFVISR
jgi:hypothetical protein